MIELVKTIRPSLYDKKQGISSFIQCVMPDASDRLRATSIKSMHHILFTLNSINPQTDVKKHPQFIVIFNNVSLYEKLNLEEFDDYDKKSN